MIKFIKFLPVIIEVALLVSCGSESSFKKRISPEQNDSLSIPTDIQTVVGIGKVVPINGIVDLATPVGGIVNAVFYESGDSVRKGEPIIVLDRTNEALEIEKINYQITARQQQIQSDQMTVSQYRTKLQDKSNVLSTSEKLVKTGAETPENVNTLKTEKQVLIEQLAQSQKAVGLDQSDLKALQSDLQIAQNNYQQKSIKAPSNGVILRMSAKVGQAVQPLQSFATFAPLSAMVVKGEADEMFANRLKIGQKVSIHYIGNSKIITTGKIISLSPDLSNKSLFTDEPGEQQDRRVRRFKVLLDSTDHLLINAKVECNIDIKN